MEFTEHPLVVFPDLITQHLCDGVFMEDPWMFGFFPNKFKTQEMCDRLVEIGPDWVFKYVPDQFKTDEM